MSSSNLESCALNTNGALKPASAITWFNDADDDIPMATISPVPAPLTASSSSSSLTQGTLNNFVHLASSGKLPATTVVAGTHRSGRTFKLSTKIRDSAPSISSVLAKRAATGSSTLTTHKRTSASANTDIDTSSNGNPLFEDTDDDNDNDLPDLQECSDNEDEDGEDEDEDTCLAVEEFDCNQAFADADHNASYFCLILLSEAVIDSFWQSRKGLKKDKRTADLKTVFTKVKGHVNPHTGDIENGWSCDVCRYTFFKYLVEHYFIDYYIAGLKGIPSMSHFSGAASQLVIPILLGNIIYALYASPCN